MQYNSLKKATEGIIRGFSDAFQVFLEEMSEEEFNKIPIVKHKELEIIETSGWVFLINRPGGKFYKVYAIFPSFFRAPKDVT